MTFSASMLLALTLSSPTPAATPAAPAPTAIADAVERIANAGASSGNEAWTRDVARKRPAVLPALYTTFAALQALDVYSTRRGIGAGAHEANPLMERAAANPATMVAVKALSTAGTIYFAERAWKRNPKGAILLMAAINGVSVAISARNLRNAR